MARRLDHFPESIETGMKKPAARVYPWDEWFDGAPWELKYGVDFDCGIPSMRSTAASAAHDRFLEIRTRIPDNETLIIQVFVVDDDGVKHFLDWNENELVGAVTT